MKTQTTRFASKLVSLAKKAVVGEPDPVVRKGSGGYADWLIVTLHGLREKLGYPYRQLMEELRTKPPILEILGLKPCELPHFTTVCARMQDLKMPVWRDLLDRSVELHELGETQAIDATTFDRIAASRHYAERTGYTFKAVKTTALIDCKTGAILDIHSEMKKSGDAKVGWQVLTRNLTKLSTLLGDKGYDDEILRWRLQAEGVKPLIKHREFKSIHRANNSLIPDEKYSRRSKVESIFSALKRKYGDRLRSRTWYGQFRELVLKAAVRNVDITVEKTRFG